MSKSSRGLRIEQLETRCVPVVYQLDSINLGMYTRPGEDPNNGPGQITSIELDNGLEVIAPYTKAVRIFSTLGDLEALPAKARAKGLDVILTAYLTSNLTANAAEIQKMKEQAVAGRVQLAVVGSEVLQRGDLTPEELIAYINDVKSFFAANNINVQVTTADTYTKLLEHPEVMAACETVIYANVYGFWENQPVNVAVAALDRAYNRLRAAAPTKTIRISETGWPSDGSPRGAAVPSPANAAYYFNNFISWARAKNVDASYFAAFDEPWKFNTEGDVGPHWGLFDGNFNLKPGMQPVFDGQTVPDNWSTLDFFTSASSYTTNIGTLPITGATGSGNTVRINNIAVPPTSLDSQGALAHAYPLAVGANTITLDVLDSGGLTIASATKNITYDPGYSTLESELLYIDSVAASLTGTLVLDTQRQLLLGLLPGHVRGVAPNATEIYMADRAVLSTSTHQAVRTLPFTQPLTTNNFVVSPAGKLFAGTEVVVVASNTLLTSAAPSIATGNAFGGAAVPGGPSSTGDGAFIYANSNLVRIDTTTLTSAPVDLLRSAFVSDYTVRPDGQWLLASSYGGGSQAYSYDLSGATPTLAATIALGDFTGETAFLREPWAVAGSAGNPANGGGRFTVFNYHTGGGQTTIFSPLADNLAVSADGQRFFITTGDDLGVTAYHVAADGVVTREVTYNLGINRHVLSSIQPANDDLRQLVVKPALDFTPPVVTLVTHPESVTPSTNATFTFAATDIYGSGVSQLEVRFDGGTFVPATSPATFTNLPTGPHTFEVRASDNAGNTSSPLTFAWHILIPPTNILPPSFTGSEDTPLPLPGLSIQDADAGSDPVAVTITIAAGTLTLRTDVAGGLTTGDITGNNTPTLTVVAPLPALNNTLAATQGLVFTGATDAEGDFTLTLTTNDHGNMGSTVELTDSDTSTITLVGTNDAPTIVRPTTTMTPVPQNSTTSLGDRVSTFAAATLADGDWNAQQGVAITAVDETHGTWEFSLDDGATWTTVGSVSALSALLVRATDRVRFIPQLGFVGAATLTYHGWDQTAHSAGERVSVTGYTGGMNAFSMATCGATVTVGIALRNVNEDTKAPPSDRVQKLVTDVAIDADGTTRFGVAVVGATGTDIGTWQYFAGRWQTLTATSNTALLLRETTKIRFVPGANQHGAAVLWYHAWDQSTGVAGTRVDLTMAGSTGGATPFSTTAIPAFINVVPINDAPVLDVGGAPVFTPVTPSTTNLPGDRVRDLLGSTVTDVDGDAWQMAITAISRFGSWEWQPFGSSVWQSVGVVSAKTPRFLQPFDKLRLVPNNGYIEQATITYKVFDGQSYSRKSEQGFVRAIGISNTAPELHAGGTMTPLLEDSKQSGDAVATLVQPDITDTDSNAQVGIALTEVDANKGTWSYSLDRGVTWRAVGYVSPTNALLLRGMDRLRFVPFKNQHGTMTAKFNAWDQTRGTAGQRANVAAAHLRGDHTAFSTASELLTVSIQPVNDRPTLNTTLNVQFKPVLPTDTNPPGDMVAVLLGGAGDVDGDTLTVVVVGQSGQGTWERQQDGTTIWTPINASRTAPVFLTATDRVRFVPLATFRGTAKLLYQVSDLQSLSAATEVASVLVNTTDDRPTLSQSPPRTLGPVLANTTNPVGTLVADLLGNTARDADPNASIGIAVTIADSRHGAWEFSTDDGSTWQPLPAITPQAPQRLSRTAYVRFIPHTDFHGVVQLSYKAWDAASQNPTGPRALSVTTATALLAVNAAPTWG